MNFLSLLPTRVWAGAIAALTLVLFLVWSHATAYTKGQEAVRAEWTVEKLQTAQQTAQLLGAAARTTSSLQASADNLRKNANAQIHSLDLERDELVKRLRNRPARDNTSGVPADAGTAGGGPACSGASLYAQDSEFLAGEAARADKLRIALAACQTQYRTARDLLQD